MKKVIVIALFLVLLSGCSTGEYHPAMDSEIYKTHEEKDVLLTNITNENILFFDLNAEGIGVHQNAVFLPPCLQASKVTYLEILQMLPYTEFVPLDGVFVDPNKVNGEPVLLIELMDKESNSLGLMATHSRIVGLEGKECLTVSRTEVVTIRPEWMWITE